MITIRDVTWACDLLRPVYDASGAVDGRVSIEVDPRLAHDTEKTIAEAGRLWRLVDRPNLFIKIPATHGRPARHHRLPGRGHQRQRHVDLLAGTATATVMDAFLDGMERAQASGRDLACLASVASFFVSRVDTEIDHRLDAIGSVEAEALRGKAAIANARLAFRSTTSEIFTSERWRALARTERGRSGPCGPQPA